jgi:hypothetical protein
MTTNFQLEHYLRNEKAFLGVFASNKLPKNVPSGSSLIVNYSKAGERGSHWVAMRGLNTHNTEYFDSYGFDPDDEDMLLGETTNFKDYLKKHSIGRYTTNKINFQSLNSDVCGEYASWFIKYGIPEINNNGTISINPKWRDFIKNNNSYMNDKLIKKVVGIR